MLTAPHPMTVGYEGCGGKFLPVFAEDRQKSPSSLTKILIDTSVDYAKRAAEKASPSSFCEKKARALCYKKLKRAAVYPTEAEVELLSAFSFSDDVTEHRKTPLADRKMIDRLHSYRFIPRVFGRLFGKRNRERPDIPWVYGVIALCKKSLRPWYRLNVKLWEAMKLLFKK